MTVHWFAITVQLCTWALLFISWRDNQTLHNRLRNSSVLIAELLQAAGTYPPPGSSGKDTPTQA